MYLVHVITAKDEYVLDLDQAIYVHHYDGRPNILFPDGRVQINTEKLPIKKFRLNKETFNVAPGDRVTRLVFELIDTQSSSIDALKSNYEMMKSDRDDYIRRCSLAESESTGYRMNYEFFMSRPWYERMWRALTKRWA